MAKIKASKVVTNETNNTKATKKIKSVRIKESRFRGEGQDEIRNFIIILIIVLALVVGIYFLSKIIVNKRENENTTNNTQISINYDVASVGMILNRPDKEYYVMVYDKDSDNAMSYSSLITKYSSKEDSKKIFYCDLGNKLNNNFKATDNASNPKASKIEEFAFGEVTLLFIKDGKVKSYTENYNTIKSILK